MNDKREEAKKAVRDRYFNGGYNGQGPLPSFERLVIEEMNGGDAPFEWDGKGSVRNLTERAHVHLNRECVKNRNNMPCDAPIGARWVVATHSNSNRVTKLPEPKRQIYAPSVVAIMAVVALVVGIAIGAGLMAFSTFQAVGDEPSYRLTQPLNVKAPGYAQPQPPEGIAKPKVSAVRAEKPEELP